MSLLLRWEVFRDPTATSTTVFTLCADYDGQIGYQVYLSFLPDFINLMHRPRAYYWTLRREVKNAMWHNETPISSLADLMYRSEEVSLYGSAGSRDQIVQNVIRSVAVEAEQLIFTPMQLLSQKLSEVER